MSLCHVLQAHNAEEFYSSLQTSKFSNYADVNGEKDVNELESDFDDALKETYKHILSICQSIGSLNYDFALIEESVKNIKEWKILFEKDTEHLQLDLICEDVIRTIQCAVSPFIINFPLYFPSMNLIDLLIFSPPQGELLNYCGEKNPGISSVFTQLRQLYVLLDMILAFGDNLMQDFLVMHSMVSVT